jgi:hypothetical protein
MAGELTESFPEECETGKDFKGGVHGSVAVATCIQKLSDLQSTAFPTRINCVHWAPQTRDNCE